MKIYILSHRYGTDMSAPAVFRTEEEANAEADRIMEEVLRDAYEWDEGDSSDMTFEDLVKWADDSGNGDARYFWNGYDDATEVMVTSADAWECERTED